MLRLARLAGSVAAAVLTLGAGSRTPDVQGVWVNNTVTPFVRPAAVADKASLSDAELSVLKERAARLFNGDGDTAPGDEMYRTLLANPSAHVSERPTGDFNYAWAAEPLEFEHRTSQIVAPADGQLPPLTAEGARKQAADVEAHRVHPADGPEDRNLLERCITHGAIKVGFVQSRNNSYYQIVQTRDTVLLYTEMMGEARIIRMNQAHLPPSIRKWTGDSIGRWDGDTLVVDTTNFHPGSNFRSNAFTSFSSEHFHVVERLRQLDADTMEYEVTIEDPTIWTTAWTAVTTWKRSTNRLFEFACHEGNYAMEDILRAARAAESGR